MDAACTARGACPKSNSRQGGRDEERLLYMAWPLWLYTPRPSLHSCRAHCQGCLGGSRALTVGQWPRKPTTPQRTATAPALPQAQALTPQTQPRRTTTVLRLTVRLTTRRLTRRTGALTRLETAALQSPKACSLGSTAASSEVPSEASAPWRLAQ